MSDSIPALIAEAKNYEGDNGTARWPALIRELADALESLSTSPGDDEREALAVVLAEHWRRSSGLTYGSPDTCACGVETHPVPGEEDISERRARGFAEHQADMASARRLSPLTQEALLKSLEVAMLGTTDGGLIEPESEIPAGEMFRLAAEWVEDNLSRFSLPEPAEVEWEYGIQSGWLCEPVEEEPTEERKAKAREMGWRILRRKPGIEPGPWLPVEEGTK